MSECSLMPADDGWQPAATQLRVAFCCVESSERAGLSARSISDQALCPAAELAVSAAWVAPAGGMASGSAVGALLLVTGASGRRSPAAEAGSPGTRSQLPFLLRHSPLWLGCSEWPSLALQRAIAPQGSPNLREQDK